MLLDEPGVLWLMFAQELSSRPHDVGLRRGSGSGNVASAFTESTGAGCR